MTSYKIAIILLTLLMHFIYDFHIQGILAEMKQKSWWSNECNKYHVPFFNYRNDYKMALIVHSVECALFTMLPLIVDMLISERTGHLQNSWILFLPCVLLLTVSHYLIDDKKANELKINLVQDQLYHITFILISCLGAFPIIGLWW